MKLIFVLFIFNLIGSKSQNQELVNDIYYSLLQLNQDNNIIPTSQDSTEEYLTQLCKNVKAKIESDYNFCRDNCMQVYENCKDSKNAAHCVGKLKAESESTNLFFQKCHFPRVFQDLIERAENTVKNKCFITRSAYHESWVDKNSNSCHCSVLNAEPCSIEDLSLIPEFVHEELISSGICPNFEYKNFFSKQKSIFSISLSNNKLLHCSSSLSQNTNDINGLVISTLSDKNLENYCKNGPISFTHINQNIYPADYTEYNCEDVTSVSVEGEDSCKLMCQQIEKHCRQFDSNLINCIEQRLTAEDEKEQFNRFKCYHPKLNSTQPNSRNFTEQSDQVNNTQQGKVNSEKNSIESDMDMDGNKYCELVLENSENKDECFRLCNFAKDVCEVDTTVTRNSCLYTLLQSNSTDSQFDKVIGGVLSTFKKQCKVYKNEVGKGFVWCKYKGNKCKYSEWTEWSECNGKCIKFDKVPTRYRTRRIISGDKSCERSKIGTIQFEICANLPRCIPGTWLEFDYTQTGPFSSHIPQKIANYEIDGREKRLKYPQWVSTAIEQYPELLDGEKKDTKVESENKRFVIKKSVFNIKPKGAECGCPDNGTILSFAEFINKPEMLKQLELICRENVHNQLVFKQRNKYIFYCNLGLLVMEESAKLRCNEPESTEFSPCIIHIKSGWRDGLLMTGIIGFFTLCLIISIILM